MGFLDNTTITVDAILTKKGREKLSKSEGGGLGIRHYAFADDEIDYALWDTSHPNGSTYYGAVLENMPLLEAFVDETQVMRYKLYTADKDTPRLAYITNTTATFVVGINGNPSVNPATLEPTTSNIDELYTFTLLNTDVATMVGPSGTISQFGSGERTFTVKNATQVEVRAKDLSSKQSTVVKSTVVFVTGQTSGATMTFTINNDTQGNFGG
tara:strand:- start:95 stop:730 length:636 start_codon:yes stop_codon:yes gene_type:complete